MVFLCQDSEIWMFANGAGVGTLGSINKPSLILGPKTCAEFAVSQSESSAIGFCRISFVEGSHQLKKIGHHG